MKNKEEVTEKQGMARRRRDGKRHAYGPEETSGLRNDESSRSKALLTFDGSSAAADAAGGRWKTGVINCPSAPHKACWLPREKKPRSN